jgi:hypothetical protein
MAEVTCKSVDKKYALDKVVPQDACRILQHADKNSNLSSLILDGRSRMSLLDVEKFPQFTKAGETPVAFLGDKPMVSIYWIVLLLQRVIPNYTTHG